MLKGRIKLIDNADELPDCLDVLNVSYRHRDGRLGIERSYKNADLSYEKLKEQFERGVRMYGYIGDNKIVAFLSFKVNEKDIKIKDIVVLPEYQRKGIGARLIDFVKETAKSEKAETVKLGFLYDIPELRSWYEKRGFVLTCVEEYPTARVGRMEWRV
ncbi:MAG: GNAT family N-acetyltransferase [Clostridia bacterium]|nr:GNAT family N-acetyltransferase [Clostridia bacterium]